MDTADVGVSKRIARYFRSRNYEIIDVLGYGGMGVVYLAEQTKLGRMVALKVMSAKHRERESSRTRFAREARLFAQIRHRNIAMLYDYQDEEEPAFMALEYIDGHDLEYELRNCRIWQPREVVNLIIEMANALSHTHELGILHRDIKPGNILIENRTGRFVLTDFGLAKGSDDDTLTGTGYAVGTPAYMAPEQIRNPMGCRPDTRADLFSLAVVSYELTAGRHPFGKIDDARIMRYIVKNPPRPLLEIDPTLPKPFVSLLEKMLRKDPDERFQTPSEVEAAFRELIRIPESDIDDDKTPLLPRK